MPFRERQAVERSADHDAGIGDHAVEAVEALNKRVDRVGNGFCVSHIAFDGEQAALARVSAAQPAFR